MLANIFKKFFGTKNEREIKRIKKVIEEINKLEKKYSRMSDGELATQTVRFRERLRIGNRLEDIKIESFATVREVAKRVLGMKHYDVQLIGGMVLHEGKIAEMKTGEGKTLVATCPIYLNSLLGKGVHVITVNDYLAERDRELMKPIFDFLGITSGVLTDKMSFEERKKAYLCDITYGTNSQFGFDYLRDNLVTSIEEKVQREHNYCIIDEIDSVLIDEARTPLIISDKNDKKTNLYEKFYVIANILDRSFETEKLHQIDNIELKNEKLKDIPKELRKDYEIIETEKNVVITDKGIKKLEKLLGKKNMYDLENIELLHYLKQAIIAKELYCRDKEYLVKNNEILIIDTFTGRVMEGRRFGNGLHEALEAKEGLEVKGESKTIATITLQSYFKLYQKLAGMTGTGETEAAEFENIYDLKVVVVPTNKPIKRIDHEDLVYKTHKEKMKAILEKVEEINRKGQPILIGTSSVKGSEELSILLKEKGLKHSVLNAKYHEKEAEIISQAGRYKAITIATNMAGRGTDILLGGNPKELVKKELNNNLKEEELLKKYEAICKIEKEKVKELGGLYIIGTEKHESRRIDNQLRGRAGRQGDVGESQFFLSFEDKIMELFGTDKAKKILEKLGIKNGEIIKDRFLNYSIEIAQKKIEEKNFSIRKNLVEYDEILDEQRKIFYSNRDKILKKEDVKEIILAMGRKNITREIIKRFSNKDKYKWDISGLILYLKEKYFIEITDVEEYKYKSVDEYIEIIVNKIKKSYDNKEKVLGKDRMKYIQRDLLFKILDEEWQSHIKNLDILKTSIHLRAYAQKKPIIDYKIIAGELFEEMINRIYEKVSSNILKVEIVESIQTIDNSKEISITEEFKDKFCDCGSGKKADKCCLRKKVKKIRNVL